MVWVKPAKSKVYYYVVTCQSVFMYDLKCQKQRLMQTLLVQFFALNFEHSFPVNFFPRTYQIKVW